MRWVSTGFVVCSVCWAQAPRTWDTKALAEWASPVAGIGTRPGHFTEAEYYAAPMDNLRTYPVYHPDREPAGYWESLQKRKPEPLVEAAMMKTQSDWLRAGKRVFEELDIPFYRSSDPKWIARYRSREALAGMTPRSDGTLPFLRWAVTSRGVEIALGECSSCHMRLMPDGALLHGAPQNESGVGFIGDRFLETNELFFPGEPPPIVNYRFFGVPWIKNDIHESLKTMAEAEAGALFGTHIPGVFARINGSPFYLTKMPDLIGVKDRKYFDATATHNHRGIGDLMRYGALVAIADSMDFGPHRMFTDQQRKIPYAVPDEVLFALATYIYSLEPPANLYKNDARAPEGRKIFEREGCGTCHTPPLYTNNKVTPAKGFRATPEHAKAFDVLNVSVGTDPNLALNTRKGTGYYKVPSLKGVWYRGLYMHDGSLASLEDMFDPARLLPTYLPTGFRMWRTQRYAVPGHEFGLKLSPDERAKLIAFLRTL